MKLLSINVGQMTPLPGVKAVGQTGIFKTPVAGPVAITAYGLEAVSYTHLTLPTSDLV